MERRCSRLAHGTVGELLLDLARVRVRDRGRVRVSPARRVSCCWTCSVGWWGGGWGGVWKVEGVWWGWRVADLRGDRSLDRATDPLLRRRLPPPPLLSPPLLSLIRRPRLCLRLRRHLRLTCRRRRSLPLLLLLPASQLA